MDYLVSIENKGLVVCSQLHVGSAGRSGPANPHITSAQGLILKVPLPGFHCVCLLHTEEANGVDALIIHQVDNCGQEEKGKHRALNVKGHKYLKRKSLYKVVVINIAL